MNFHISDPMPASSQSLRVAVVLFEGFSLMELACLQEPLVKFREASPEASVSFGIYTPLGADVRAASGAVMPADGDLAGLERHCRRLNGPEHVFVLVPRAPNAPQTATLLSIARLVRTTSSRLILLGSAAAQLVVESACLAGTPVVHWRDINRVQELHPIQSPKAVLFNRSVQIGTCAGEMAALDCVFEILNDLDPSAARRVRDDMLLPPPRTGQSSQPGAMEQRFRYLPSGVRRVADVMTRNLETPQTMLQISDEVGLSQRQIERLFQRHLDTTPGKFYVSLRLERAFDLLQAQDLSLSEVALACGFGSVSALSRQLRKAYGKTARELRPSLRRRARPSHMEQRLS